MKESTIAVKKKVKDEAAARRKRAGDKDSHQSVVAKDGPVIAAVLEHNVNQNLNEGEQPIAIINFDCPLR